MPNKAYNRGSAFERRIKRELEDVGYHVIRSAGSHGPVDLSATSKQGDQFWFQCKKDGKLSPTDAAKLLDLSRDYNTTVIHVSKPKRNQPVKFEVIYEVVVFDDEQLDWEEF